MKISIIGAGEIGSAISRILIEKGDDVSLWDRKAEKSRVGSLDECLKGSEFAFFCVPSWSLRDALTNAAPYLEKNCIVIVLAKGMEETGKTADEIIKEVLPASPFALLGGPMIAEELISGKGGVAVFGTDPRNVLALKKIFENSPVTAEFSDDIKGIALAGVAKNVYALGLGIAEALGLGDDFKGWFVSRALDEMERILQNLGGNSETTLSAAGAGDLIATGYSHFSKNREVGEEVVRGVLTQQSEGSASLPALVNSLGNTDPYPLLETLASIFIQKKSVAEAFRAIQGN